MNSIDTIILEVADPAAARDFYATAFGLGSQLELRASDAPTSGFRGFTVSLTVAQPADVDVLFDAALAAGATAIKPVTKSFWGYGGVLRAPDGTLWKIASSAKKNTGPATGEVESVVLLLGVDDVLASKKFYADRGLPVRRSFGRKYVEFDSGSAVTLALYGRRAAAKDAGVPAEGSGSHRLVISGAGAPVADPDGFVWETSHVDAR